MVSEKVIAVLLILAIILSVLAIVVTLSINISSFKLPEIKKSGSSSAANVMLVVGNQAVENGTG